MKLSPLPRDKASLASRLGPLGTPIWWTYDAISRLRFSNSSEYWESRYAAGKGSGAGSIGRLATYKADFINDYVQRSDINSVVEFGCGDGDQLDLATYPDYTGIDVSRTVVENCRNRFAADTTKRFLTLEESATADVLSELALSLDVIYHLVEDDVFESHMNTLFANATRAVIVYSSNEDRSEYGAHIRHRKFTEWVDDNTDWTLVTESKNPFPYDRRNPTSTSWADFYLFEPSP